MANLGRVDILVNNASTPGGLVQGPLAEASDELLMEDVNTKVIGYFRCAKAVEPHMRQQHWGRIINIGGLSGRQSGNISGLRNAAIAHLTKTLSDQLGPVRWGLTRRSGALAHRHGRSVARTLSTIRVGLRTGPATPTATSRNRTGCRRDPA